MYVAMYVCICATSPISPLTMLKLVSDSRSVCTECTSHDSLHPAMLHGVTEILYTVSGSGEVISNIAVPFSVELRTILAIDSL